MRARKYRGLAVGLAVLCALMLVMGMGACKKKEVSISINCASTLEVGAKGELNAVVKKGDEVQSEVVLWAVDNQQGSDCGASIVDGNFLIAQRTGTVIVTAVSLGKSASVSVEIVPPSNEVLAQDFRDSYADVLALSASTITLDNYTAVYYAMVAYNALIYNVRTILADEYAILLSLQNRLDSLNGEKSFKTQFSELLEKTVDDIVIADEQDVLDALLAYEALYSGAQALLAEEIELIEEFKERIDEINANILAAQNLRQNYADVLALQPSDINLSHEARLHAMYASYLNELSDETKQMVQSEYNHLQDLLIALTSLQAAEGFKTQFADQLLLQADQLTDQDVEAVEAAYSAFNALVDTAKAHLSAQEAVLEELYRAVLELKHMREIAQLFKEEHSTALAVTVDSVTVQNREELKDSVRAASQALQGLEPRARLLLEDEEAVLLSVLNRIAELDVEQFTSAHQSALSLSVSTVEISMADAIMNAQMAFNALDEAAKAKVWVTESYFTSLLDAISVKSEVRDFKANHSTVLALTVDSPSLESYRAEIEAALDEFENLSSGAKAELGAQKNNLDELAGALGIES